SQRTYELVGSEIASREIDIIRVKGKMQPVCVHELLNGSSCKASFNDGLTAYRAQDWDLAETAFRQHTDDSAAQAYLDRIIQLRISPPPVDWDGVWVFETK
ncbi:MAG: adenylate/guanylate cyclase domain-containing protein, partial [Gallionellaceae bacterium]